MICLGIESSCDETALALVCDGKLVDALLSTQIDVHEVFGGVVPELASREHLRVIGVLYDVLLQRNNLHSADVDVYAVSRGPGLLGSLLVGVAFAKALALAHNKTILGINHLHAHLLAAGLESPLVFPALGVLVSGGHTNIYRMESPEHMVVLGKTLDDAAGEAFDKVGKFLGFPYPAGRLLDALAQQGHADAKLFPRPYIDNDTLDFSFSGLKTSAINYCTQHQDSVRYNATQPPSAALCNMCASFNLAVVDTLCIKTERALKKHQDIQMLILAGGVAANQLLRKHMDDLMSVHKGQFLTPSPTLCTDNAAMVAYNGWVLANKGYYHSLDFETIPRGHPIPNDMLRGKLSL